MANKFGVIDLLDKLNDMTLDGQGKITCDIDFFNSSESFDELRYTHALKWGKKSNDYDFDNMICVSIDNEVHRNIFNGGDNTRINIVIETYIRELQDHEIREMLSNAELWSSYGMTNKEEIHVLTLDGIKSLGKTTVEDMKQKCIDTIENLAAALALLQDSKKIDVGLNNKGLWEYFEHKNDKFPLIRV